jgi:hypothetical protein
MTARAPGSQEASLVGGDERSLDTKCKPVLARLHVRIATDLTESLTT